MWPAATAASRAPSMTNIESEPIRAASSYYDIVSAQQASQTMSHQLRIVLDLLAEASNRLVAILGDSGSHYQTLSAQLTNDYLLSGTKRAQADNKGIQQREEARK
jgi:hypothetical protein